MGKVEVKAIQNETWGHCISLSNGIAEVLVTLDFGPRIIRFGMAGKENMLWEDRAGAVALETETHRFDKGVFRIGGGHRLWTSPEEMPRTYCPDNEKVAWEQIENGVSVWPAEEAWTQIQKEMDIRLEPDSAKLSIIHRVVNQNAWNVKFAPWALTCMAAGGREVIPQPAKETGLLGNRILALWPYARMTDSRVYWGDKYIVLDQDPGKQEAFKLGINNEAGWAAYFNFNALFIKRYAPVENGTYPDFGVSYETYTNQHFLEMETLGELKELKPGEAAEHEEQWLLYDGVEKPAVDEVQIESMLCRYL